MILDDILLKKHDQLSRNSYLFDIVKIIEGFNHKKTKCLYDTLSKNGLSIIGEIKKASPKKGLYYKDGFDPVKIALKYDWAVDAIAVVTEESYYLGNTSYIKQISEISATPIIRKDFIISPIQIFQAKEIGASAITLSASILDKIELREFIKVAHGIHLDAIVEVRNEKEIEIALNSGARIICICNYNFIDFKEDILLTLRLSKYIPSNILLVSEGGITTCEDIKILKSANVKCIYLSDDFLHDEDLFKSCNELREAYG